MAIPGGGDGAGGAETTVTAAAPAPGAPGAPAPVHARTVLAGCSFAGLEFLYRLARRRPLAPEELLVIEPRARHPYVPLTHESAAGMRGAATTSFDTATFVEDLGARWMRDSLRALDPARRTVVLASGAEVSFDRLVIAVGSVPDVPAAFAASSAVTVAKFPDDATALRRRLHVLRVHGTRILRAVVVGAGLTGVEWSAELAGSRVDGVRVATTLVGDEQRVLPALRPGVANRAAQLLSRLGVELLLGRRARDLAGDHIILDDGVAVPFDVIVWAGGTRPHPVVAALGLPVGARGHLLVTPRLAVSGSDAIFGLGDCIRILDRGREWPAMDRAIEAIWHGAYLARRFSAGTAPSAGAPFRRRREFLYGISFGPRRSAVVYRSLHVEARAFVWLRRLIRRAYYARFRWVAWRRRGAARARAAAAATR